MVTHQYRTAPRVGMLLNRCFFLLAMLQLEIYGAFEAAEVDSVEQPLISHRHILLFPNALRFRGI